jgi:hypothetical protein
MYGFGGLSGMDVKRRGGRKKKILRGEEESILYVHMKTAQWNTPILLKK